MTNLHWIIFNLVVAGGWVALTGVVWLAIPHIVLALILAAAPDFFDL